MSAVERYRVGGRRRLLTGVAVALVAIALLGVVLVIASSGSDDAEPPVSSAAPRRAEPTGTLGEITVETDAPSAGSEPVGPDAGSTDPSDSPPADADATDPSSTDGSNQPSSDDPASPPGTAPPPPAAAPPELELDVDIGADDLITLTSRDDVASWTGETLDLEFVDAVLWEGTPPGGLRVTISSDQLSGSVVLPWPLDAAESAEWVSVDVAELTNWRIDVGLIDSVEPAAGTSCIEPGENFCMTDAT